MNQKEFEGLMDKKGKGDLILADLCAIADEIAAAAADLPSPHRESAAAAAEEMRQAASRLVAGLIRAQLAFHRAEKGCSMKREEIAR